MTSVAVLLGAVASSVAVCAVLQALLPGPLRRAGLVDLPGERSSHLVPTPRGGGLAVLGGLVAGLAVWTAGAVLGPGLDGDDVLVALVVGAGVATGAVGLADDVRGLPPRTRVLLQLLLGLVVGLVLTEVLGVSALWAPATALGLTAYVNAVNFMDGVDTITAGHGVVCGTTYAAAAGVLGWEVAGGRASPGAGWLLVAGLLLAATSVTFAFANGLTGGRARLFLGDVGSYGIGAAVTVLAVGGFLGGLPLVTALAPTTIWLADTGHTLLLRAAAGQPVSQAHRTHAYQRLVDTGWSHRRVSAWAAAATALCSLVGLLVLAAPELRLPGAALLLLLAGAWVALPALRGRPSPWGRVARGRFRQVRG